MNKILFFLVASFVLVVTGCDQGQPQANDDQTQPDQPSSGRAESKTAQAADLVGYNDKKLRKSVDKVLDARDQRDKNLEENMHKADDQ